MPETAEQADVRMEKERRNEFIQMYKRIDQTTVSALGLRSKAAFGENAIEDMHGFSLL